MLDYAMDADSGSDIDSSDAEEASVFRPPTQAYTAGYSAQKGTCRAAATATKASKPIVVPTMACRDMDDDTDSSSEDDHTDAQRGKLSCQLEKSSETQPSEDVMSRATKILAELPPEEAAPKNQRGLVDYLRKQNTMLRTTYTQLKEQVDKMASAEKPCGSATLDFAHILELAREFGDIDDAEKNFDDDYFDRLSTAETAATGSFSISTPRGEHDSSAQEATAHLRAELEKAQTEALQLKAALAERDEEVLTLRRRLGEVTGDVST